MSLSFPLRQQSFVFSLVIVVCALTLNSIAQNHRAVETDNGPTDIAANSIPATEKEAWGRARWMHELVHGTLQVMHRDFFGDGDDEALSLPSQSLEDVFKELARSWSVEIRWLGVNATKDIDHEPQNDFEKAAAKALEAGKTEYFEKGESRYRYVGAIRLQNQCLKCHVPDRKSLEDRVAGLVISMPIGEGSQ